ncbi:dynein regulatory complex subunit 5 [Takifugu rubripes]|uniref:dynein regulatory complex subunit 5 n=1 Tax=Takifugu rubripes TaxID=31033 RepID=UPI001145C852|nr:dynein regulatory complex subunit 5 [Takifugu rubripes]
MEDKSEKPELPRPDEVQDGITSPVLPLHVTKETQETSPAQPGAETSTNLNPCNPPGSVAPVEHSKKMKRRIFAEDPDWCLDTVPCLSNICLETIVANYQEKPVYDQLMPVHKDFVHERLSTSLPLHITANLISDGAYWRRCCEQRWDFCDVSCYGHSWKRMFFERHMAHVIEFFVPGVTEPATVLNIVPLCNNYIKRLNISQLLPPIKNPQKEVVKVKREEEEGEEMYLDLESEPDHDGPYLDHFDFNIVLHKLPNLEELHLVYQVKNCGMNFEWSLFEITDRDCESLGKALKSCLTLKTLHVCLSHMDDNKCCRLVKHLSDHPSLRELDLSYNLIGDKGAKAISQLLNKSRLETLKMCNNCIGDPGAKAIAQALSHNGTLLSLNLRLNCLQDEGGEAIAGALLRNDSLCHLHLGANELTGHTAAMLAKALRQNKTLRSINLSFNKLGVDGGKALQAALSCNTILTECDVRLTEIEDQSASSIKQVVWSNQHLEG